MRRLERGEMEVRRYERWKMRTPHEDSRDLGQDKRDWID